MTHDYASLLSRLDAATKQLTFSEGQHVYRWQGKHVPGVTTTCKVKASPMLEAWKVREQVKGTARTAHGNPPSLGESEEAYVARLVVLAKKEYEHERLAQEAADVGRQTHALIEQACREMAGLPAQPLEHPPSEQAFFRFMGWRRWAKETNFRVIAVEGLLFHPEERYAGRFDLLAEIEGELGVPDWKPAKGTYPEHHMQSAAYRKALEASTGCGPLAGWLLKLPDDGSDPQLVRLGDGEALEEAWQAFRACLRLYRWEKTL